MRSSFFSFLLLSFASIEAFSQQSAKQRPSVLPVQQKAINTQPATQAAILAPKGVTVLQWSKPITEKFNEDEPARSFLQFKGAIFNPGYHGLPSFFQHIPLDEGTNQVTITLVNPVYEPLTSAEASVVNKTAFISSDVKLGYWVGYDDKIPYAELSFIPLRKNPVSGQYEKLVSFSLNVQQSNVSARNKRPRHTPSYAANSVLATGKWYRIGVTKDGVYKLDYTFFKKMGYTMDSLKPQNIRIYGNGGYMLPEPNANYRPDDLIENPVYVKGQTDTAFSKTDYVLFYGQGPTQWTYDNVDGHYHHTVNLYTDTTYYFITDELGPGKRIGGEPVLGSAADTCSSFDDYAYHETDQINLISSGYEWFGEYFDATTSYSFGFNFPNLVTTSPVYANTTLASRDCSGNSYYTLSAFSSTSTFFAPPVTCIYYEPYASFGSTTLTFNSTTPNFNVTISKQTAGAIGWLYYLEVNARRALTLSNNQMEFRDSKTTGVGKTTLFRINSSIGQPTVWDVTNPLNVDSVPLANPSPGIYQYALHTDTLRQFIAFGGNTFDTAIYVGPVPSQNLHADPQVDLVIVSSPMFITQAKQLASFHESHDGLKVTVRTPQQIYNEFSSGRQDPIAIRDYMNMLYTRSTNYANRPKYLLLFGDASYDPKYRLSNNTNYVVTYESPESFDPTSSFVSDDYFALLDSNEGVLSFSTNYHLDIGVGRFPADNVAEAQTLVNKVISYETPSGEPPVASTSCCNPASEYNLGNWRNVLCFIAHDGDDSIHENEADQEAQYITATYPNFNINKIYCDAYQEVQTPGGTRYPEVNVAIDDQVDQGLLILNYTGHGGPLGLAVQRILGFNDILSWNNSNRLSLFFTASCSFAPFDNPEQLSAGEMCVKLPSGGNIALMTTVRETYSSDNTTLNGNFYSILYSPLPDGSLPRIGDLFAASKNASTAGPSIMFTLLGDPAVRLAYPAQKVYTSSINSKPISGPVDTLKAFSKVTIKGYVGDAAGNPLTNFNGVIYPTIYDKADSMVTLDNGGAAAGNTHFHYMLQKSVLFRGRASVTNGNFIFSFVVPKDINYRYGDGKISYYAQNGVTDATGNDQNVIIGGTLNNVKNSGKGPQVRLYMNDSNFAFGGMTNENPQLFAVVTDSNGINTTGNGIGHDITAVLDNNTQNTYDLTNYYQPALNSYQKGTITYNFSSLPAGKHSLSLRVWNVFNNTSQAYTEFTVELQSKLQLDHVLNYPNPFTTHTQFYFEINEVCDVMDVQIQIFTVAGKLVKNILTSVKTDSYRSQPIDWDGRDDYGDKIGNGVYIYHIKVRASDGTVADTYQKLVIL
jgi:hypothetical protein